VVPASRLEEWDRTVSESNDSARSEACGNCNY
jgi:hypothetical protein